MHTVLITGASRGIGREFVSQYQADGWRVIAACRDPAAAGLDCEVHALDVTDPASVAALGKALHGESIDLLINNAGTYGPRGVSFGEIDYDAWEEVLRTNTLGPLRVAEALADQVARSDLKLMAFVSSKVGSIADNSGGGGYIYRSSKTALNMAIKSLSIDIAARGVTCLLFHPGWVKTDMGGDNAPVDTQASVAGMRDVIGRATASDTGHFFNYDGQELPW